MYDGVPSRPAVPSRSLGRTPPRVSVPSHSRDAELVAFRVEHHDVVKVLTVGLLADGRGSGGDQLGCLRADELLALGHVPWRRACHPDVDVHPVLGRLALRHPEKADGWADAVRI